MQLTPRQENELLSRGFSRRSFGQIAAMVAGQQIQTQASKKAGGLLKGLFNQFAVPVKEDENVPPPNRPFPWEQ